MIRDFRLATYLDGRGPRSAICVDDHYRDVGDLTGRPEYATVLGILEDWASAPTVIGQAISEKATVEDVISDPTLLAPVLFPGTIYCCGANYQDHMDAVAKHRGMPPQPSPRSLGLAPFHFLKAPRCVIASGSEVAAETPQLDFEIELAVVIGRVARGVSAADALDYVAGYTIANDLSARDRVLRPQLPDTSPFKYDWAAHKNFDGACPLGPLLVPASMVPDPQALTLKTWVNDTLRQNSTTGNMIYSVAEQIESLSRFNSLYPGDVILTGTPAGVGAETGDFLAASDTVRMQIEGLGELLTRIG